MDGPSLCWSDTCPGRLHTCLGSADSTNAWNTYLDVPTEFEVIIRGIDASQKPVGKAIYLDVDLLSHSTNGGKSFS